MQRASEIMGYDRETSFSFQDVPLFCKNYKKNKGISSTTCKIIAFERTQISEAVIKVAADKWP